MRTILWTTVTVVRRRRRHMAMTPFSTTFWRLGVRIQPEAREDERVSGQPGAAFLPVRARSGRGVQCHHLQHMATAGSRGHPSGDTTRADRQRYPTARGDGGLIASSSPPPTSQLEASCSLRHFAKGKTRTRWCLGTIKGPLREAAAHGAGGTLRLSWLAKMEHDAEWDAPSWCSVSLVAVLGLARTPGNGQDWTTR